MSSAAGSTWAGTYRFGATELLRPTSIEELKNVVGSTRRVRALGTRHSFNDIADSPGTLVSVADLPRVIAVDSTGRTARVSAGLRYGEVAAELERQGWALHNMGSLPHISVAGAVSTGTHGSGNGNGSLSTAVCAIEFVDGAGEVQRADRSDPSFNGMIVSLGALGIITELTLEIQPTFQMRQDIYRDLGWDLLLDNFEEITSSAYSVSIFPSWDSDLVDRVWVKTKVEPGIPFVPAESFFGAGTAAVGGFGADAQKPNVTTLGGVVGPWSERLPHFRIDSTPSNGDEIQTEYFVDRRDAIGALSAVRELGRVFAGSLIVSELRTVAADDLWLSPAFGRDSLAIHFTWKNDPVAVAAILPRLEAALSPFSARPHWGKWFALDSGSITQLYPGYRDFVSLCNRIDPTHTFRNAYLDRVLALGE